MKGCGVTGLTNLGCYAFVAGRSGVRWALYCCGCKSERHLVRFGEDEISEQVLLLLTAGEDGGLQSE